MNILWILMLAVSLIFLMFGDVGAVLGILNTSVAETIELGLSLCAVYVLWLGLLQILDDCGLSGKLARILAPVIRIVFGKNVGADASKLIAVNLSCNVLGLGNAGVPAGIMAMQQLDKGSPKPNRSMVMLFCLNCCSLQLLPTTVIGLRTQNGSVNSADIVFPVIIVSIVCCLLCVGLVNLMFLWKGKNQGKHQKKDQNKIKNSSQKTFLELKKIKSNIILNECKK